MEGAHRRRSTALALALSALASSCAAQGAFQWDSLHPADDILPGFVHGGIARAGSGRIYLAAELGGATKDAAVVALNPDTSWDDGFDGDGLARYDGGGDESALAVAVDASSRVVVLVHAAIPALGKTTIRVLRYDSSGGLDGSFGVGGVATYDVGNALGLSLAVDGQARAVVGGRTGSGDALLLRWTPAGALDASFGGDGVVTYDAGSSDDRVRGVAVDAPGAVYAAVYRTGGGVRTLKVDSSGALDASFSGDGIQIYAGIGSEPYGIAVAGSGGVFVVGKVNGDNLNDLLLLKYRPDGELDSAFSGDGVLSYDSGDDDVGRAVALDGSGGVYAAGDVASLDSNALVVKYAADGSTDTAFSGDGVLTLGAAEEEYARAVAIGPGGAAYVWGYVDGEHGFLGLFASLAADGSVSASVPFAFKFSEAAGVALDGSGRAVVVGNVDAGADTDVLLLRYKTDGSLDAAFSGDGVATHGVGAGTDDRGLAAAVDGSGSVYVAGDTAGGAVTKALVLKFGPTGSLDVSFSGDGAFAYSSGGGADTAFAVAVDGSGSAFVAVTSDDGAGGLDVRLLKLKADGTLDGAFGTGGVAAYSTAADEAALGLALDGSGGAFLAGYQTAADSTSDALILKFGPDGALDAGFDGDGALSYARGAGSQELAAAAALDASGSLVAAGRLVSGPLSEVLLLKLKPDGTPDGSFGGGDGVAGYDGGGFDDAAAVAVDAGNRVYVAGTTTDARRPAVWRFRPDGTLDTGFDGDGLATLEGAFGGDAGQGLAVGDSFVVAGSWAGQTKAWTARSNPLDVSRQLGTSGGTIAYNPPKGPVRLTVPAGAFSQLVSVTVGLPSSLPSAPSAAGSLAPSDVGVRVDLHPAVQPSSELTLEVGYRDADVVGLDEERLVLARYDPGRGLWVPLPSVPDPAANRVTGRAAHFSTFQVMQLSPSSSLASVKAFPNPLRPAAGHGSMNFLVPPNATVRLYTVAGVLVRELQAGASGLASWDGRNEGGRKAASGAYFALVESGSEKKLLTVAVQR